MRVAGVVTVAAALVAGGVLVYAYARGSVRKNIADTLNRVTDPKGVLSISGRVGRSELVGSGDGIIEFHLSQEDGREILSALRNAERAPDNVSCSWIGDLFVHHSDGSCTYVLVRTARIYVGDNVGDKIVLNNDGTANRILRTILERMEAKAAG